MVKDIIFVGKQPIKCSVELYKDKIIYYNGLSFSRFYPELKGKVHKHTINSKFNIYKLDKYDKEQIGVNANYTLRNESLEFILGDGIISYLNLNYIDVEHNLSKCICRNL